MRGAVYTPSIQCSHYNLNPRYNIMKNQSVLNIRFLLKLQVLLHCRLKIMPVDYRLLKIFYSHQLNTIPFRIAVVQPEYNLNSEHIPTSSLPITASLFASQYP